MKFDSATFYWQILFFFVAVVLIVNVLWLFPLVVIFALINMIGG